MFPSPASEFRAGLLALAPLLVGVVPFGMIYDALALSQGLSPAAALLVAGRSGGYRHRRHDPQCAVDAGRRVRGVRGLALINPISSDRRSLKPGYATPGSSTLS